ncbi:MAG: HdeD family acid-resistance protein [Acidimicrobiia bacterium]
MTSDLQARWLNEARGNARVLMVLGFIQIIVGIFAIGAPLASGVAITMLIGSILILAGIIRLFCALKAGSFGSGVLAFLGGAVAILAGGYILSRPGVGLAALTWILALYFVISGIGEVIVGFGMKPVKGWGWTVFSGVAGLVLGIMIWRQFPLSGAWAVGTLVGIYFIMGGWGMIGVASAAKAAASTVDQ